MACDRCPCPDVCLRRESFCRWAAEEPVDPMKIRAICERSRLGGSPSVPQLAANAIGAIGRVATALIHGEQVLASSEERERRLAICRGCEHLDGGRCKVKGCGCFVEAKSRLLSETCPLGFW